MEGTDLSKWKLLYTTADSMLLSDRALGQSILKMSDSLWLGHKAGTWPPNTLNSQQTFEFSSCLSWQRAHPTRIKQPLPRLASGDLLVGDVLPVLCIQQVSLCKCCEEKNSPSPPIKSLCDTVAETPETAKQSKIKLEPKATPVKAEGLC